MSYDPEKEFRNTLLPLVISASGVTGTVADGVSTTLTLSAEGTVTAGKTIYVSDTEYMYVTAVTSDGSNEATVVRGVDESSPTAHSAGTIRIVNYYIDRMPMDSVPMNSEQLVMQSAGGGDDFGRTQQPDRQEIPFEFFCYSDTENNARELWRLVREGALGLQGTDTANIRFHMVQIGGNGTSLIDPDGKGQGWPYVSAVINVTFLSLT